MPRGSSRIDRELFNDAATLVGATGGTANGKASRIFVERTRSAYNVLGGAQAEGLGASRIFVERARNANADVGITP